MEVHWFLAVGPPRYDSGYNTAVFEDDLDSLLDSFFVSSSTGSKRSG